MTHVRSRVTVAILILLASVAPCLAGQKYAGRVHSVTESQLVLKVSTELMTFQIDKGAVITLNGKTVKATELKGEDEATVQAEKGDDAVLKATSIAATRTPAGGKRG
jgi:hypothetical protein